MSEGDMFGNKCCSCFSPLVVHETDFSVPDLNYYTTVKLHLGDQISLWKKWMLIFSLQLEKFVGVKIILIDASWIILLNNIQSNTVSFLLSYLTVSKFFVNMYNTYYEKIRFINEENMVNSLV